MRFGLSFWGFLTAPSLIRSLDWITCGIADGFVAFSWGSRRIRIDQCVVSRLHAIYVSENAGSRLFGDGECRGSIWFCVAVRFPPAWIFITQKHERASERASGEPECIVGVPPSPPFHTLPSTITNIKRSLTQWSSRYLLVFFFLASAVLLSDPTLPTEKREVFASRCVLQWDRGLVSDGTQGEG